MRGFYFLDGFFFLYMHYFTEVKYRRLSATTVHDKRNKQSFIGLCLYIHLFDIDTSDHLLSLVYIEHCLRWYAN